MNQNYIYNFNCYKNHHNGSKKILKIFIATFQNILMNFIPNAFQEMRSWEDAIYNHYEYWDILEYWKLLLYGKMFLKTLAKRQQKQRFAFPSHSGKSMSNYILGVSWIFQALSSSSTHTAGTIRESVSAWLENMKWKSWELMTTSMTAANPGGQLSCCLMLWWTAEGYHSSWLANTGPVSCLWYWQMHTRNPSMQKKENETVTVNEGVTDDWL